MSTDFHVACLKRISRFLARSKFPFLFPFLYLVNDWDSHSWPSTNLAIVNLSSCPTLPRRWHRLCSPWSGTAMPSITWHPLTRRRARSWGGPRSSRAQAWASFLRLFKQSGLLLNFLVDKLTVKSTFILSTCALESYKIFAFKLFIYLYLRYSQSSLEPFLVTELSLCLLDHL